MPLHRFADSRPPICAKLFDKLYINLKIKQLTTTASLLKTNWQNERHDDALVARLRHRTSDY